MRATIRRCSVALNPALDCFDPAWEQAQALAYAQQAQELYRAIEDRLGVATVATNLAILYEHFGEYEQALAANQQAIEIHLESGDSVVILEGWMTVHTEENTDAALLARIDDAYEAKYNMRHGTPVWELHMERAFAWTDFTQNTTRWQFSKSKT